MEERICLSRWLRLLPSSAAPQLELCRALLTEALFDLLFPSKAPSKSAVSKITGGYADQNRRFARVAAFLDDDAHMAQAAQRAKAFWQKHPIPNLANAVRETLDADRDFQSIPLGSGMERVRDWLSNALSVQLLPSDAADLLTVLTLLSITRSAWEVVAEKLPLADKSAPERRDAIGQEIRDKKRSGLSYLRGNRFADAIQCFQDALLKDDTTPSAAHWNGEILYWLSQAHRGARRTARNLVQKGQNLEACQYLARCAAADDGSILHSLQEAFDWNRARVIHLLEAASDAGCPEARLEIAKRCLKPDSAAWDRERGLSLCRELTDSHHSAPIRGAAYWLLYQCYADVPAVVDLSEGKGADFLLEEAYRCGFPEEAVQEYRRLHPRRILQPLLRGASSERGVCLIDGDNLPARILSATLPDSWSQAVLSEGALRDALDGMVPSIRLMFLGDDAHQNLLGLLRCLETIRSRETDADISACIRGSEERLAPMVDTALNHMDKRYIPVTILDDDKRAAQQLLSRHPLLYPVRGDAPRRKVLRFIALGDTRGCQWLVREAFWMASFRDETIEVKITILGDRPEDMRAELARRCPGMFSTREQDLALRLPRIDTLSTREARFNLSSWIADAARNGEALYFAVDTGDALENLETAIRLREATVRAFDWLGGAPVEFPIVAFRCDDPDIARLSANTIVVNENRGMGWFNSYGLLPYGTATEYTWDSLTGDIVERLAYCFHMVYSGIPRALPEDAGKAAQIANARRAAELDYFTRSYNRDSCRAAALSLPYRVMQSQYPQSGSLIPSPWNPLDGEIFFSEMGLRAFADRLNGAPEAEASQGSFGENQRMAEWEHDRWSRFMLARGWVSATPEQAEAYTRAGNPRQQLYLGRMHPCITPYCKLEALEKHLRATVGLNKNFRKSDLDSILATEHVLRLCWIK